MGFGGAGYREGEADARFRPLLRLGQSRSADSSFGCALLLAFGVVGGLSLFAHARLPGLILLAVAALVALRGLSRLVRWRGVAVELAIDGDALVVGQAIPARIRLLGRKRVARINLWLTGFPPMPGNMKYRFFLRRHPLANVDDLGRTDHGIDDRELSLDVPTDVQPAVDARWEVLVELDDLRGEPLFTARFAARMRDAE